MREKLLLEKTTLMAERSTVRLLNLKNEHNQSSRKMWHKLLLRVQFEFGTSGMGLRSQPLRISGCHDLTEHSLRLSKIVLNPQEKEEKEKVQRDPLMGVTYFMIPAKKV